MSLYECGVPCLYQLCVIACGFAATTVVFSQIVSSWHVTPSITTLSSAAVPITQLPFPTVIVCPGEDTPIDNAALPTKLFNLMDFSCDPKVHDHDQKLMNLFLQGFIISVLHHFQLK